MESSFSSVKDFSKSTESVSDALVADEDSAFWLFRSFFIGYIKFYHHILIELEKPGLKSFGEMKGNRKMLDLEEDVERV
jgi:hypothetical protein